MKKFKRFAMITLLSVLLLSGISAAEAVPSLPSSFYGSAKTNGTNIPEGTILRAFIDGEEVALTIVQMFEGESVYSLDVPGDDPTTISVVEGGKPGDVIQIMLGDVPANETGSWVSGTNVEMDLTFDEPTPAIMTAGFYGTVKTNGENPPAGTIVKAVINSVTYVTCTVSLYSGNAVYAINIPGDDPDTPGIVEGGVHGDTVQFLINNTLADQMGTWVSGSNTEINLTATLDFDKKMYYFPLVSN